MVGGLHFVVELESEDLCLERRWRKLMCVAYPGRVVGINGRTAEVDFDGNLAMVKIGLVDVNIGDYVLVHAGMAIEAMDEGKARSILEAWGRLRGADGE